MPACRVHAKEGWHASAEGLALTALGKAVELAEVLFALRVDELEGIDAKAIHLTPVGRDAIVVKQPRELRTRRQHLRTDNPLNLIMYHRCCCFWWDTCNLCSRALDGTLGMIGLVELCRDGDTCEGRDMEHRRVRSRTMWQDSGWCARKSRMRQPSWMFVLGLGLKF